MFVCKNYRGINILQVCDEDRKFLYFLVEGSNKKYQRIEDAENDIDNDLDKDIDTPTSPGPSMS